MLAGNRRNEIEGLIGFRHDGILPDTDDSDWYLHLWCWHNLRKIRERQVADLYDLGRRRGVELPQSKVEAIIGYVNRYNLRKFSASRLGELLKLTEDERVLLKITTIRAVGVTDADMARARRILAAERARLRRRAKGAKPRFMYEAKSLSRSKPWKAEGISRRTWFRRRKQQQERSANAA